MKTLNGYSVATRLCQYSTTTTESGLNFPALCVIFGPVGWDLLAPLEKLYFKRIAEQYKTTAVGNNERVQGEVPSREQFLSAVFGEKMIER